MVRQRRKAELAEGQHTSADDAAPGVDLTSRVQQLEADMTHLQDEVEHYSEVAQRLRDLELVLLRTPIDSFPKLERSSSSYRLARSAEPDMEASPEKNREEAQSKVSAATTATQTDASCLNKEPWPADSEEGSETSEIDSSISFAPGDTVRVVVEFLSWDKLRVQLQKGLTGTVLEIDEDGDMRVHFPILASELYDARRRVHSRDFMNLRAAPKTVDIQDK